MLEWCDIILSHFAIHLTIIILIVKTVFFINKNEIESAVKSCKPFQLWHNIFVKLTGNARLPKDKENINLDQDFGVLRRDDCFS